MKIQTIILAALLLGFTLALTGPVPAYSCGYGDNGYMNHSGMGPGMGQMGYGQMGPGNMGYYHGGGQFSASGAHPGGMVRPPVRPQGPQQLAPPSGTTPDHQH